LAQQPEAEGFGVELGNVWVELLFVIND